jgi:hypothetical protein
MSWLSGNWSKPFCIGDARKVGDEWWRGFQIGDVWDEAAGVYRLVGLQEKDAPIIIDRIGGRDDTGTLYIGAASCLMYRISALVKEHHPSFKAGAHKALSEKLKALFPPERLAISWEFADDAWARERELLATYLAEFGELPPHNDRR